MRFTEKELGMLAVLRRDRDAWPSLRIFMLIMALFLAAAGIWEIYSHGWHAMPLLILLVSVMAASHTYRNWYGPPEASLLLKLIEEKDKTHD